jgi:deoxyadenosine/deoxycytidine kinase
MRTGPFIVVAGNIGTGKSSVVASLSDELGLAPHLQGDTTNPYLSDFYRDMPRWALASQLKFLADGIATNRRIQFRAGGAIEESSVFEHFSVFCAQLHSQGVLSDRDHRTLADLYHSIEDLLTAPDLMIYLHAPAEILHRKLKQQNPQTSVTEDYLRGLQDHYQKLLDTWFRSPVLSVDVTEHDVRTPAGLAIVAEMVTDVLPELA